MPYDSVSDLPENVKNILPSHAQEIFLAAFNSAWEEYDQPNERRDSRSREETAYAVAWNAVKKEYQKNTEGKWVKKED